MAEKTGGQPDLRPGSPGDSPTDEGRMRLPGPPAADPLQVRIGQRIRRRREELGMTQQELAGPELTRGFISQLEKGIVMPSLKSLELIASRLYKPISYFLEEPPQSPTEPDEEVARLAEMAIHRLLSGDEEQARAFAQRALAAASRETPGPLAAGRLQWLEGLLELSRGGDPGAAAERLQAAVQALKAADDPTSAAFATVGWAYALLEAGQPARAAAALDEFLRASPRQGPGDAHLEIEARVLLAIACGRAGDPQRAILLFSQARERCRRTGWWYRPAETMLALGMALAASGQAEAAQDALAEAAELGRILDEPAVRGEALRSLGALRAKEAPAEAARFLDQAVSLLEAAGRHGRAVSALVELADVLSRQGQMEAALQKVRAALSRMAGEVVQLRLLLVAGQLLARMGQDGEARKTLEEAVRLAESHGQARELAAACSELGNLLRRQGHHEKAGEYLARAVSLYAAAQTG